MEWVELQGQEINGRIDVVLVPAHPTPEQLRLTPWYYMPGSVYAAQKSLEAGRAWVDMIGAEQAVKEAQDAVAKFDPNQPRAPAGTPEGGQWTDGGGATYAKALSLIRDDDPARDKLARVAGSSGLEPEDLEGLVSITSDKPNDPGYLDGETSWQHGPVHVDGSYDLEQRIVHIHPNGIYAKEVLVHEVGHHVTMARSSYADKEELARNVIGIIHHRLPMDPPGSDNWLNALAVFGLRHYSVASPREFLADAFMVMRTGSGAQQKALASAFQEAGYNWLDITKEQ